MRGLLTGGSSGQQGTSDAADAVHIAKQGYAIPTGKGIAIYADIEPQYDVSSFWIDAWIEGVSAGGYIPGIYCGSNQPGIIAGMASIKPANLARVIIWSCMPHNTALTAKKDVPTSIIPPGFSVGGSSAGIDMWQYCLDFGDFDFSIATDRAFTAMWQP